jgi:hypothetical protein
MPTMMAAGMMTTSAANPKTKRIGRNQKKQQNLMQPPQRRKLFTHIAQRATGAKNTKKNGLKRIITKNIRKRLK